MSRRLNLDASGNGLAGNRVALALNRSNPWAFADEVQFRGTTSVSQPFSLASLPIGALCLGSLSLVRRSEAFDGPATVKPPLTENSPGRVVRLDLE